jgi:hypothetical protein
MQENIGKSWPIKPQGAIRVILVGDIVGKPGMEIACQAFPKLRDFFFVDVIIANAENAADGAGLTISQYKTLVESGVDAITLGDHIYKKKEIATVLKEQGEHCQASQFSSDGTWFRPLHNPGQVRGGCCGNQFARTSLYATCRLSFYSS